MPLELFELGDQWRTCAVAESVGAQREVLLEFLSPPYRLDAYLVSSCRVGLRMVCDEADELGFSSLEVYGLEHCKRSKRWVQETRTMARRLARLREG